MPSAIQKLNLTQWTAGLQPSWTVAGVRGALSSHEQGDFSTSALLIDAMGRSTRLGPVTNTRLMGLFSAPFDVQPPESETEDAIADAIALQVGKRWLDMFPEADLAELWKWYLFAGVAFGEMQWVRTGSEWWPRLEVWHPQWITADEDNQVYQVETREKGTMLIPFGGGDGKWIVLGRGRRPWMNGLVRSLAVPFLVEAWAERDWARYSERHGMPILKGMVPAVAEDNDKGDYFDDLRALSTDTTVILPTHLTEGPDGGAKFDLDLVEATARTWEGFEGLLRYVGDSYAISLTGNNLTTLITEGSLAAAKEAGKVRTIFSKGDAEELSTGLRAQTLVHYVAYNVADSTERVPWPHWDVAPAEDTQAGAEALKTAGEALKAIQEAGYEIEDPEEFGERFGVKLRKVEAPAEPEPGTAPPPPGSDPDREDDRDDEDDEAAAQASRSVKRSVRVGVTASA